MQLVNTRYERCCPVCALLQAALIRPTTASGKSFPFVRTFGFVLVLSNLFRATVIMYLRRKGFAWEDIIKITGLLFRFVKVVKFFMPSSRPQIYCDSRQELRPQCGN